MSQSAESKVRDGGFLNRLKEAFISDDARKVRSYRRAQTGSYSVTGNGVAYRKASDYLRDEKVVDFLEEAEQVRVAR